MKKNLLKVLIIIFVVGINISCDRITKDCATKHLKGAGTIKLIDNLFVLKYAENEGGFLSLGANVSGSFRYILFTLFPVIILIISSVSILLNRKILLSEMILFSCIIGGGIGNIYDRIANHGHVVDFMNFGIGSLRTGILNCADLSITFGCLFYLVLILLNKRKFKKNKVNFT